MFGALCLDFLDATSGSKNIGKPFQKDLLPFVSFVDGSMGYCKIFSHDVQTASSIDSKVSLRKSINLELLEEKVSNNHFEPIDTNAKMFLNTISDFFDSNGIKPSAYFPISDGGANIELNFQDSYYNIEIANGGEASFYKEVDNQIPEGWDYSYSNLISRLKTEFNGGL